MTGLLTTAGAVMAAAALSLVSDALAGGFAVGAAYMIVAALVINSPKRGRTDG